MKSILGRRSPRWAAALASRRSGAHPRNRAAEAHSADKPRSFLDIFGDVPLHRLIANWRPVPLTAEDGAWLGFPPAEFLEWARSFPRHPFDTIPPSPSHKAPPSFLLSQTHRIWLSTKLIVEAAGRDGRLVDFGSLPFSVPLTLRDYFGYRGPLIATAIQGLPEDWRAILNSYSVDLDIVDLDPSVVDPARGDRLPTQLQIDPASVDTVTMLHVIEHLYHPMSALREAARILRPGGHLLITTDNAMMLQTLLNYAGDQGYTFEPVEGTSAMSITDWRGHVRFFTAKDLQTMVAAAGFRLDRVGYEEIFYDAFHAGYFAEPTPSLPGFKKDVLRQHRQFANDIFVVATRL